MRIRIDINEVNAMADSLTAAAETIAEIGADVGLSDLPAEIAAMFQHTSATTRSNFESLAAAYRNEALALRLRALIAHFDVNKAVAIYPPPSPPAPVFVGQPAVAGSGNYNPSRYYSPGSPTYNQLTAEQKKMNNAMAMSIVMPGLMKSYSDGSDRLNAANSAMYEQSRGGAADKLGRWPTPSDVKYYAPNTYKSNY